MKAAWFFSLVVALALAIENDLSDHTDNSEDFPSQIDVKIYLSDASTEEVENDAGLIDCLNSQITGKDQRSIFDECYGSLLDLIPD